MKRGLKIVGVALPFFLLGCLWQQRETLSYRPATHEFPSAALGEWKAMPIEWFDDSIWLCHVDNDEWDNGKNSALEPAKKLDIWGAQSVKLQPTTRDYGVAVAVSPNATVVRSRRAFPETEILRNGQLHAKLQIADKPEILAISPDASRVAAASNFSASLFEAKSGRQIGQIEAEKGNFCALEFSPDNQKLAALTVDGWLFIANAKDGKLLKKWRAHQLLAGALAWSGNSQQLVTATNNRPPSVGFRFKNVKSRLPEIHLAYQHGAQGYTSAAGVRITMEGKTGHLRFSDRPSMERSLKFWHLPSGKQQGKTVFFPHDVHSLDWQRDKIVAGTVGKAILVNQNSAQIEREFPLWDTRNTPDASQTNTAVHACFSPDGRSIAVANTLRLRVFRVF